MNELELSAVLKKHPAVEGYFLGVYARNELPIRWEKNEFIIANIDEREASGSHWVLLFNSQKPLYFDSYGLFPLHAEFYTQLGPSFQYNKKQIQGQNSTVCGHYCAYFASQLCLGRKFSEIRNQFTINTDFNDRHILTLYKKTFVPVLQCCQPLS